MTKVQKDINNSKSVKKAVYPKFRVFDEKTGGLVTEVEDRSIYKDDLEEHNLYNALKVIEFSPYTELYGNEIANIASKVLFNKYQGYSRAEFCSLSNEEGGKWEIYKKKICISNEYKYNLLRIVTTMFHEAVHARDSLPYYGENVFDIDAFPAFQSEINARIETLKFCQLIKANAIDFINRMKKNNITVVKEDGMPHEYLGHIYAVEAPVVFKRVDKWKGFYNRGQFVSMVLGFDFYRKDLSAEWIEKNWNNVQSNDLSVKVECKPPKVTVFTYVYQEYFNVLLDGGIDKYAKTILNLADYTRLSNPKIALKITGDWKSEIHEYIVEKNLQTDQAKRIKIWLESLDPSLKE
ncbi:MAG: hypothetical protein NXI10_07805 [bacterium]|nr:hypothetical protein [bacterium]